MMTKTMALKALNHNPIFPTHPLQIGERGANYQTKFPVSPLLKTAHPATSDPALTLALAASHDEAFVLAPMNSPITINKYNEEEVEETDNNPPNGPTPKYCYIVQGGSIYKQNGFHILNDAKVKNAVEKDVFSSQR